MSVAPDIILKKHGLKNTRQRIAVLDELSRSDSARSQPDLEKTLKAEMDRVTLYRILSSFQENGIVHAIMDQNGTMNYAPCTASCTAENHHDEHLHFNCSSCNRIFCLEVKVPSVRIPEEFKVEQLSLTARGICNLCLTTKQND